MDLDELERLLREATAGPWTVDEEVFDNEGCPETVIRAMKGIAGVAVAVDFGPNNPRMREANAALIAALRNSAEELIRDARRWRELIRSAEGSPTGRATVQVPIAQEQP